MIKLSPKLQLPNDAVTQTFLILGKRGSGKTNTAVVLVEEMVKLAPVVILDPIDAWWGLKSSFAGDEEGLKVYVFGGQHPDLPLDPDSGELMARLFIEHRISMVLSMKGWSVAQRARFVTAFCTYLLAHNGRVPVHVVLEEADAFIPQQPKPDEAAMLGATDRLIRWGRMEGIGATAITQRAAAINKNTTTQAETLIAHRIIGPQDRDAIEEWIKFHGSKEERNVIMGELPHLQNGEAYVWSPEWLNILQRVMVRRRHTFDSAATPKLGEKHVEPKHLTPVDLEKLRGQLTEVVAKAKQDDPKELRKELASVRLKLADALLAIEDMTAHPLTELKEVEVYRLPDFWPTMRERMDTVAAELTKVAREFADVDVQWTSAPARVERSSAGKGPERAVPSTSQPAPSRELLGDINPAAVRATRRDEIALQRALNPGGVSRPQQAILDGLAFMEVARVSPAKWTMVAMLASQSPRSSGYRNNLSVLRARGLIVGGKTGLALTNEGRKVANQPSFEPTARGIQEVVMAQLSAPQRAMLETVIAWYPKTIEWDDLAERSNQSPASSGYRNNLSVLRSLGLIVGGKAGITAAPVLFLE